MFLSCGFYDVHNRGLLPRVLLKDSCFGGRDVWGSLAPVVLDELRGDLFCCYRQGPARIVTRFDRQIGKG
jgi:hypothetical protein